MSSMKTNLNKDGKAQSDGKPSTESASKPQVNKSNYPIVFYSFLTGPSAACQNYRTLTFLTHPNFANMPNASKHIHAVTFLNKDCVYLQMFVLLTFHIKLPFHFRL